MSAIVGRVGLAAARRTGTTLAASRPLLPPPPFAAASRLLFSTAPAAATAAVPVPAALVKQLRDRTGASMGKCRQALGEEAGDVEKAVEWLRRRGVKSMEKRATDAVEALLALHVSPDSSAGAVVEIRCETDYVTRSAPFQDLCICLASVAAKRDTAKGVAAASGLGEAAIGMDAAKRPEQIAEDITVGTALLEVGSVLGERLVLGEAWRLAAQEGGVVAGYVHPKFSDGVPNTGRMAALVAVRAVGGAVSAADLSAVASTLSRHTVAAQPRFCTEESVPAEVSAKEREVLRAAHIEQIGAEKSASINETVMTKVLDGKMQKWMSEIVLLRQEMIAPGVSTDGKPVLVSQWLSKRAAEVGAQEIVVDDLRLAAL